MSKVNGVYKRDVSPWLREIEGVVHSVERCSVKRLVNVVSTSNGVRSQEGNHFSGGEATGILKSLQDRSDAILGLRNKALNGGSGCVRASGEELQAWSTLYAF